MTLSDMSSLVTRRLNLSSTTATTRVKDSLKERYAQVLSAIGMAGATRTEVTANAVISTRTITISNVQKILGIRLTTGLVKLEERDYGQLRNSPIVSDPPTAYAIQSVTSTAIIILLNSIPASTFGITADVITGAAPHVLADGDSPTFSVLFHDVLVYGAMAVEYAKLEKLPLADYFEKMFDKRLLQLQRFMDGDPS